MKLAIQFALRNLLGAGLRTWLNAIVLSFSFVVIIWMKGVMIGWDHQAKNDMMRWEIAGGQYWHEHYDPYDPMSLDESHAPIPELIKGEITSGDAEPMLIVQGTLYPDGRMLSVNIKGIRPEQTLFALPAASLNSTSDALPAFIGAAFSRSSRLEVGDRTILRWRDANGTFDAAEIEIVEVFASNVPAVEMGQVYIPLLQLYAMTSLSEHATVISFKDAEAIREAPAGWILKSRSDLTRQVDDLIKTKTTGQTVLYLILMLMAMLAIFDTQVLSIFRRQKEIGTYIALGYTRQQVVGLFTVEGAMHAVLAAALATVYGMPFLIWQGRVGWTLPVDASDFGMAMAQTLYPVYTLGLVFSTMLLVLITTTVVSYLPARRIARMNPTEALRGKLQ